MADSGLTFSPHEGGPLDDKHPIDKASLSLYPLPFGGKIILRGAHDRISPLITSTLNLTLPAEAGSVTSGDSGTLFWLGSDEWLLTCGLDEVETRASQLHEALGETPGALVTVSNYYVDLHLEGDAARGQLSHGTPLDLRDRSFAVGQAWQTRFAHCHLLIHRFSPLGYRLMVRWSMASYLWDRLAETANDCD